MCSSHAAPFRPDSANRWTAPSIPPPRNAGFEVHGSASSRRRSRSLRARARRRSATLAAARARRARASPAGGHASRSLLAARIGASARIAKSADRANELRKPRVTAPSSAPISESRTCRRPVVVLRAAAVERLGEIGDDPFGASLERRPQIECDRHLLAQRRIAVEDHPRSGEHRRAWPPRSRSWERSGATSASATTSPACRAPIVIVPLWTTPASGLTARA